MTLRTKALSYIHIYESLGAGKYLPHKHQQAILELSIRGSCHIPLVAIGLVLKIIKSSNEVATNFTGKEGTGENFYLIIWKTFDSFVHYNCFLGITCFHLEQEKNRLQKAEYLNINFTCHSE